MSSGGMKVLRSNLRLRRAEMADQQATAVTLTREQVGAQLAVAEQLHRLKAGCMGCGNNGAFRVTDEAGAVLGCAVALDGLLRTDEERAAAAACPIPTWYREVQEGTRVVTWPEIQDAVPFEGHVHLKGYEPERFGFNTMPEQVEFQAVEDATLDPMTKMLRLRNFIAAPTVGAGEVEDSGAAAQVIITATGDGRAEGELIPQA